MNEILSSSMFLEVFCQSKHLVLAFLPKIESFVISHEILSKVPEIPKLWPEYA